MSTLSKNALSSLFTLASVTILRSCYVVFLFQVPKQNRTFIEQPTHSISSIPLKLDRYSKFTRASKLASSSISSSLKMKSRMRSKSDLDRAVSQKGKNLFVQLDQKELQALDQILATCLNWVQKSKAGKKFSMRMAANQNINGEIILVFNFTKVLNLSNLNEKTALFGEILLLVSERFLENIMSLNTKPTIFGSYFQQLPQETEKSEENPNDFFKLTEKYEENPNDFFKLTEKYEENPNDFFKLTEKSEENSNDIFKPTEKSIFPENGKKLPTSDLVQRLCMKKDRICFMCQGRVARKKFFDERRFGILENCECMICYGCIRKAVGATKGVVKGPIWCPSCNVKSDIVASAGQWIDGKEKTQFLKAFREDVHIRNMNSLHSCQGPTHIPNTNEACVREHTLVPVN